MVYDCLCVFFYKQNTAYEMRISDWSSDVCSSDLPVVGKVVTGLGELSESGVRARGLTILAPPLAQVVAPTRGRVAFAGEYRGYGRIVIIDHGHGWTTLLAHLDRLSEEVGSIVSPGAPIGTAGRDRRREIGGEPRRR